MAHNKCDGRKEDDRKEFVGGAFRDGDKDKIQYIECLSPLVLEALGQYLLDCSTLPDGSIRPCDNWKKGISLKSYIGSKMRHTVATWKLYAGYRVENCDIVKTLCAELFNTCGMLHEILESRLGYTKNPVMTLKNEGEKSKDQNIPLSMPKYICPNQECDEGAIRYSHGREPICSSCGYGFSIEDRRMEGKKMGHHPDYNPKNNFASMPQKYLGLFYNVCTNPCDMLQGPCACGATHHQKEWPDEIQKEVFGNISTKESIIKRKPIRRK